MAKFKVGDLVSLRDDRRDSEGSFEPKVGLVVEVKQLSYARTDALLTAATVVFGEERLTLSENDFVLVKRLSDEK
jgi:hypothetical protein